MTNSDKRYALGVAAAFLALLGWAAVSGADLQDAEISHRVHCQAVPEWEADKAAGLVAGLPEVPAPPGRSKKRRKQ